MDLTADQQRPLLNGGIRLDHNPPSFRECLCYIMVLGEYQGDPTRREPAE
jgi:hypothetical protein